MGEKRKIRKEKVKEERGERKGGREERREGDSE